MPKREVGFLVNYLFDGKQGSGRPASASTAASTVCRDRAICTCSHAPWHAFTNSCREELLDLTHFRHPPHGRLRTVGNHISEEAHMTADPRRSPSCSKNPRTFSRTPCARHTRRSTNSSTRRRRDEGTTRQRTGRSTRPTRGTDGEPRRCAILGAAGGAALIGVLASAAAASSSSDVQILQTAASIENLAVSTYKTALTLPYIGGSSANPVVTKFAQVTMGQHAQHADAFNAAAKNLGGKAQHKPDPAFVPWSRRRWPVSARPRRPRARSASWRSPSSSRTSRPRPTSRTRRWPRRRRTRRCSPASWGSRRSTSRSCWPCRRSSWRVHRS